jgi:hypothetical protein
MKPIGAVFALLFVIAGAFAALGADGPEVETRWAPVEAAQTEEVFVVRQVDWDHWGLELFLWDVGELQGRIQFRFLLQLKSGTQRAWTSVGYPRYRIEGDRWHDAVTRGVLSRSRVVEASLARSDRVFFSIVVPRSASTISVPVGEQTIRLDTAEWLASVDDHSHENRPPVSVTTPPPVVPASAPAPGLPAKLSAALRWTGDKPFGDGALDAGERGELLVDVYNEGERVARGVTVTVTSPAANGVSYPGMIDLADLDPGDVETVRIPFEAGAEAIDGTMPLNIEVLEPYGHDAAPIAFELTTRSANAPVLVLTDDFAVEGADLPVPRDSIVTVRLRVRNVGEGTARGVRAEISPGTDVYPAHDSAREFDLGDLEPGEVGEVAYRCYANQRAERLALDVRLSDTRTRSTPATSVLRLPLENSDTVARIVRVTPDPRSPAPPLEDAPPPLVSDVDRFVPAEAMSRPEGLAVVLGVEKYAEVPPATFASQDARTAARYFEHALGIPPDRIELLLDDDVSLAQMQRIFGRDGWLARRVQEDTEVFIYFAGHGVAEGEAFDPYLIPADGDLNYVRNTAYSLDRIVERLAMLDAGRVTLFLDACFSGLTREGNALVMGTRRLVVVPVYNKLAGVSVFSAARGSQVAHSLNDQGHGLFSYYLFKGLGGGADLDGDRAVRTGELAAYLEDSVPRAAAAIDAEQTPSVFLDDETHVLVALP